MRILLQRGKPTLLKVQVEREELGAMEEVAEAQEEVTVGGEEDRQVVQEEEEQGLEVKQVTAVQRQVVDAPRALQVDLQEGPGEESVVQGEVQEAPGVAVEVVQGEEVQQHLPIASPATGLPLEEAGSLVRTAATATMKEQNLVPRIQAMVLLEVEVASSPSAAMPSAGGTRGSSTFPRSSRALRSTQGQSLWRRALCRRKAQEEDGWDRFPALL